jgi:fucose 4-O-acetylase-like acetyltransferase
MNGEIIVPIVVFAMVFGIVYISLRHKERMTLIKSGVSASNLETKGNILGSLKWGMIFIGIGIGIIVGKILSSNINIEEEAAFFSMICLFGGMALMIYYIFARRFENRNKPGNNQ